MTKRILFLFLAALAAAAGVFYFFPRQSQDGTYCPFCDPAVLKANTFFEGERVRGLYTHKPIFPGHCLVIPKRHVEHYDMLSDAEAAELAVAIKKVDAAVKSTGHLPIFCFKKMAEKQDKQSLMSMSTIFPVKQAMIRQ